MPDGSGFFFDLSINDKESMIPKVYGANVFTQRAGNMDAVRWRVGSINLNINKVEVRIDI